MPEVNIMDSSTNLKAGVTAAGLAMDWNANGDAQVSKSVTFLRPAATTQYSAKDILNVDLAVTGATNATPIVIAATAHGLADGDYVTIASVGGNTNANGSYYTKVTGYDADHFALYTDKALTTARSGNSNYTNSGDVARLFRLKGIFRKAGGNGVVARVRIATNSATALLGDYLRVHFYRAPVTVALDNTAYILSYANFAQRCGFVDMPPLIVEGAGGDMSYSLACPNSLPGISGYTNIGLPVENGEAIPDTDLYFRLEEMSTGTPANGQSVTVDVTVMNN